MGDDAEYYIEQQDEEARDQERVTDRPKGATEDRRNGATFGWLEQGSNGVSGCGVFGMFCNR